MKYYHFQIRKKTANQALNILKTVPGQLPPRKIHLHSRQGLGFGLA